MFTLQNQLCFSLWTIPLHINAQKLACICLYITGLAYSYKCFWLKIFLQWTLIRKVASWFTDLSDTSFWLSKVNFDFVIIMLSKFSCLLVIHCSWGKTLIFFYPVTRRFNKKYRLFAGLWFGRKKPDFRTFLQPFASSLQTLFAKGTVLKLDDFLLPSWFSPVLSREK